MMQVGLLVGRVGTDLAVAYSQSGKASGRFRLCVNVWRKRDGIWSGVDNWWTVMVFGNQAETLAKKIKKGDRVLVEGSFEFGIWESSRGPEVSATCVANTVKRLDADQTEDMPKGSGGNGGEESTDDDIPF